MYAQMTQRNLGISILLAFTGGLLALPWLAIALNVYQRLRKDAAVAHIAPAVAGDHAS
ncbi:MAG TPA: hypothetical protein VK753_01390 [Xanthomonadaceae bacterium]|nr:hypothetical protein [Xanthomonadaceae bacterium]